MKEAERQSLSFMEAMIEMTSAQQRDAMSQAIKRGLVRNAQAGLCNGKPPLGYEHTSTRGLYQPNEIGGVIAEMLRGFADGHITFHTAHVALEMLTGTQTDSPRARRIRAIKVLSNPYYAGWSSWNGTVYQGKHKPLISKKQHKAILARLSPLPFNKVQVG